MKGPPNAIVPAAGVNEAVAAFPLQYTADEVPKAPAGVPLVGFIVNVATVFVFHGNVLVNLTLA